MHIRVITPVIPTGLTSAEDFQGILGPQDIVDFTELDSGPASIESAFDRVLAAPDVVAKIIASERDGVDAVVIDCMEDPGLDAARECVSIPVLGPCQTAMTLACTLGHRFSVMSVSRNMGLHFGALALKYGVATKYASTRSVDIMVKDLDSHAQELRDNLFTAACTAIVEDHADVIIIGCTGMADVALTLVSDLRARGYDVPVIDPIPVTLRMAKLLVDSGLAHPGLSYPRPQTDTISGFPGSILHTFVAEAKDK